MHHYIIVKFIDDVNYKDLVEPITQLFLKSLDIEGVNNVEIYSSCLDLVNRYDLMIKMNVTYEGLKNFDNSYIHKEWKEKYGNLIANKTIFDCEILKKASID